MVISTRRNSNSLLMLKPLRTARQDLGGQLDERARRFEIEQPRAPGMISPSAAQIAVEVENDSAGGLSIRMMSYCPAHSLERFIEHRPMELELRIGVAADAEHELSGVQVEVRRRRGRGQSSRSVWMDSAKDLGHSLPSASTIARP